MWADEFFRLAHDHCKFSGKYYILHRDDKDGEKGNPEACEAWVRYLHWKGYDKAARWLAGHLNRGGAATLPEIMPHTFDRACPRFEDAADRPIHIDLRPMMRKTAYGARPIPPKVRADMEAMRDVRAAMGDESGRRQRVPTAHEAEEWLQAQAANPVAPPKLSEAAKQRM